MITGIVIAVGFGLIAIGGGGIMATTIEFHPDRKMVTLFIIMFLVGLSLVGGGLGNLVEVVEG